MTPPNPLRTALIVSLCGTLLGTINPATAADCTAPDDWTNHAVVPKPDSSVEPSSTCDFHRWAWNTFLWMTQDVAQAPRFDDFYTLAALRALPAAPPKAGQSALLPRVDKASGGGANGDVNAIHQAGRRGILVNAEQPGATWGFVTYFSQSVNDTFYSFIRDQRLYDAETYRAADPYLAFPNGAMEFKFSWKVVHPGMDTSRFFTTSADIAKLVTDPQSGDVTASTTQTRPATVALVGVHVVGVVQNHPEFIWATFEHIDNAPNLPPGMRVDAGTPVSNRDWTFYAAKTPASASNVPNAGKVAFIGAPEAQRVGPVVNVFRQYAYGSDQSSDGKKNAAAIQNLNASVHQATLGKGSVWRNYRLIGSVWGAANTLIPNMTVTPIGSTLLSNATMETFTQSGTNCLSCHNTFALTPGGEGKNINVSHVFKEIFAD